MMTHGNEFALSRIYALGWSAARTKMAADAGDVAAADAEALNPYTGESERAKWAEGFAAGIRGWRGRTYSAGRFGQR